MLVNEPNNRIIFVPSNKSFTDMLIFQYINYMQGLNIGYTFSAEEDTPKFTALKYYIKYTGVFLPQRTKTFDHTVNYVNQMLF